MNTNQKAVVYLLALAALAMLCATALIIDNKAVPDFLGFVVVSAVGSAAGASVPLIVAHDSQPITLSSVERFDGPPSPPAAAAPPAVTPPA